MINFANWNVYKLCLFGTRIKRHQIVHERGPMCLHLAQGLRFNKNFGVWLPSNSQHVYSQPLPHMPPRTTFYTQLMSTRQWMTTFWAKLQNFEPFMPETFPAQHLLEISVRPDDISQCLRPFALVDARRISSTFAFSTMLMVDLHLKCRKMTFFVVRVCEFDSSGTKRNSRCRTITQKEQPITEGNFWVCGKLHTLDWLSNVLFLLDLKKIWE